MWENKASWYRKTVKSSGRVYDRVDYVTNRYVTDFAAPVKVSVISGSFKPGVYRVNPYSIKAGCVEEGFVETDYGTDSNTTYDYEFGATLENLFLEALKKYLLDYVAGHPEPYNSSWGRTQALQKARSKVSGQMMTYGVEAGELKETLQFLRNPLKTLRDIFSHRMIFGGPKDKLSRLTDAYLAYRFALQPLLSTVNDTIDLISKGLPSFEPGKIYSHQGLVKDKRNEAGPALMSVTPVISYRTTPDLTETLKYGASVQCVYAVPPGLMSMLGLSFWDLPSIVWELTRLSFVIDRYIAIGPWINSLRYVPETTILGGTSGIRRTVHVQCTSIERKFYWGASWQNTALRGCSVRWDAYERRVEDDLSGWPAINYGLSKSLTSVIDEIALIIKSVK